jgi:hypothetical protein
MAINPYTVQETSRSISSSIWVMFQYRTLWASTLGSHGCLWPSMCRWGVVFLSSRYFSHANCSATQTSGHVSWNPRKSVHTRIIILLQKQWAQMRCRTTTMNMNVVVIDMTALFLPIFGKEKKYIYISVQGTFLFLCPKVQSFMPRIRSYSKYKQ